VGPLLCRLHSERTAICFSADHASFGSTVTPGHAALSGLPFGATATVCSRAGSIASARRRSRTASHTARDSIRGWTVPRTRESGSVGKSKGRGFVGAQPVRPAQPRSSAQRAAAPRARPPALSALPKASSRDRSGLVADQSGQVCVRRHIRGRILEGKEARVPRPCQSTPPPPPQRAHRSSAALSARSAHTEADPSPPSFAASAQRRGSPGTRTRASGKTVPPRPAAQSRAALL